MAKMNHCVIMTVYTDLHQVNKFISTMPENWDVYVHVDNKSNINVNDIDSRAHVLKIYDVYWGSFNHLLAFWKMIEIAYYKKDYDYFHLVSGQDFWSKSLVEVKQIIEEGKIYLDVVFDPMWYDGGYEIYAYATLAPLCDIRKPFWGIVNRLLRRIQDFLNLKKRKPNYTLYGGSVYCSLTKEAVEECFRSYIAKDLLSKLKYSSIGEEIFFQTILMNSRLKSKIINNSLRYVDWSCEVRPKVLKEEDYNKIVDSKTIFCRKVDSAKSKELLNKLYNYYDFNNNTSL